MLLDFENYLKLNVNSKETVNTYRKVLSQYFNSFDEFNQVSVNAYLTNIIDQEKSASLFNLTLASFKSYTTFKDVDITFPKQKKVTKKLKTTLSRDEIEDELFPYFNLLFRDAEKRKLVVRFMMLSLMRISEVSDLKKEDVNFDNNQIKIVNGKGAKSRITFLHRSIVEDLKKEFASTDSELAFDITNNYTAYIFKQINTMLNYKKRLTAHTLRHAGAKYLYSNGVSLKALKEMLGHESLETTDIYLDYSIDEIQEQYNKVKYVKG